MRECGTNDLGHFRYHPNGGGCACYVSILSHPHIVCVGFGIAKKTLQRDVSRFATMVAKCASRFVCVFRALDKVRLELIRVFFLLSYRLYRLSTTIFKRVINSWCVCEMFGSTFLVIRDMS